MFHAQKLHVAIGTHATLSVSFRLEKGEALRVAGPSGIGKTTLLRALARLDSIAGGTISLEGTAVTAMPPPRWRRQVAYLPQKPAMLPGTVLDNLEAPFGTRNAGAVAFDASKATALTGELGLTSDFLARDARMISGGEATRVALARALLLEPRVILADEPTAHLDPTAENAVESVLRRFLADGGALLFVAHEQKHSLQIPCAVLDVSTLVSEVPGRREGGGAVA